MEPLTDKLATLPETDDWAEARPFVYAVIIDQLARNQADREHRRSCVRMADEIQSMRNAIHRVTLP